MSKEKRLFTSESVSEGHPDKVADQISDAILDAILAQDPNAHVACETIVYTGTVDVFGEISTSAYVDIASVVRETIRKIGYTDSENGFDYKSVGVHVSLVEQSSDIAGGVNEALEVREGDDVDPLDAQGAGDQGMMFGFACNETAALMPAPIYYANLLARRLAAVRKDGTLPYLRPDGKTQVTFEYEGYQPLRIDTIVVSAHHAASTTQEELSHDIIEHVIKPVIPEGLLSERTKFLINPSGRFVIGGPQGDSGLTGRKIIVDTYGGMSRHGGGCFSGKDPTKVDRSAAYMARYIAKNIVAAGLADRCELQLAYAIGVAQPVSVMVDTFGGGTISDEQLIRLIHREFDMRPEAIIDALKLRAPIYLQTAAYGHFGRDDLQLSWERTDRVSDLQRDL